MGKGLWILLAIFSLINAQSFNPMRSIRISEVMSHTDDPYFEYVEVVNTADVSVPLGQWSFRSAGVSFVFPRTVTLAPGEVWTTPPNVVTTTATGFTCRLLFNNITVQTLSFAASASGIPYSRFVDGVGKEHYAQALPTVNFRNRYPIVGPFVISEIRYNPAGRDNEYIKIKSNSRNWRRLRTPASGENGPWYLYIGRDVVSEDVQFNTKQHAFIFPMDDWFAPFEEAFVVNIDPATYRLRNNIPGTTKVYGPYLGDLGARSGRVQLAMEDNMPVLVDEVNYASTAPWPVNVATIKRLSDRSYGDSPRNWRGSGTGTPKCKVAADCRTVDNCTFAFCTTAGECRWYSPACKSATLDTCFPTTLCGNKANYKFPDQFKCDAPATSCFELGEDPKPNNRPSDPQLVNVAPRGSAVMLPDRSTTSRRGIDGNINGVPSQRTCAESPRKVPDPRYNVTLDRAYTSEELRMIRIWNGFEDYQTNYPFDVRLLDNTGATLLRRNFVRDVSNSDPNDIKYKRINEITITKDQFKTPLRTIIITAPGKERFLSIAEVEVLGDVSQDCKLSNWTSWSPCTDGVSTRSRMRLSVELNGGTCLPRSSRTQQRNCTGTTSRPTSAGTTSRPTSAGTTAAGTTSRPTSAGTTAAGTTSRPTSAAGTTSVAGTTSAAGTSRPMTTSGSPAATSGQTTGSRPTSTATTSAGTTTARPSTASTTGTRPPSTGGSTPVTASTPVEGTFTIKLTSNSPTQKEISDIVNQYRTKFLFFIKESGTFTNSRLVLSATFGDISYKTSKKREAEETQWVEETQEFEELLMVEESTVPVTVLIGEGGPNEVSASAAMDVVKTQVRPATNDIAKTSTTVVPNSASELTVASANNPTPEDILQQWWFWLIVGGAVLLLIIIIVVICVCIKRKQYNERV